MHKKSGLQWLWVAFVVVFIDRLSKSVVQKHLGLYETVPVVPHFNITLAYNKGAAFSFLDGAAGWQGWVFGAIAIGVSIAIIAWLAKLSSKQIWLSIALTLVVGGALGNLWDRILFGHVIDFLQVYAGTWYWPSFNVADSAISIGATMLVIDAFFFNRKVKKA